MYILEIQEKTLFARFKDVFPECLFLIEDEPKLYPLACLRTICHRNANCMENLCHRVKSIFDAFEEAEILFLYFEYRDMPGSIRAGVFWRDLREPYTVLFNRSVWNKFKKEGTIYEWELPSLLSKPIEDGKLHLPVIGAENITKTKG